MNRLVIVTDPRHVAARVLLPALVEALRARADMRCTGVVVPRLQPHARRVMAWRRERWRRRLQVALGSGRWDGALDVAPLAVDKVATALAAPLCEIDDGDPNADDVLRWLDTQARGTVAINLVCVKPFRAPLLSRFEMVVNYHNGRLPRFRGLRASNWSIYAGETHSGFCFHRMDGGIDSGGVIAAGDVPVLDGDTPADLELRKARAAAVLLPDVVDALCRRDSGTSQSAMAGSHNRHAFELATRVADPTSLSRAEWQRRLRAFLRVSTCLEGRWWAVTSLAACAPGTRRAFRTADGEWLQVRCADFWPASLMRGRRDDA